MPFQGFSFIAMALVGIGVVAYHFYKNREQYLTSPHETYSNPGISSNEYTYRDSQDLRRRRRAADISDCSICMEQIEGHQLNLNAFHPSAAVLLECGHCFHKKCLGDWRSRGGDSCPNCRAPIKRDSM